jgi:hypothetical protein
MSRFNFKHNYQLAIQGMQLNLLCEKQKSLEILDSRYGHHKGHYHLGCGPL